MTTKITALSTLLLLAVAVLMPACEITRPCNPEVEICVYTGNNPSGLDPRTHQGK